MVVESIREEYLSVIKLLASVFLSYIFGENIVYVLILLIHYLFLLLVMSILFHFWWENISF